MFGWNTLLTVPTAATPRGVNLLANYGQVTLAECTARAGIYLNTLDQTAQNSTMLYHFLYASLTKAALTNVNLCKDAYTLLGRPDGLCFLRVIISEAHLDTVGTVKSLRKQLAQLPTKLMELNGNIIEFHQHVNMIIGSLDSYGKHYPELIFHLFDAYEKVEDKQFSTYIMVTRFQYVAQPDTYQVCPS
jgi:hypothetical protein